MKIASDILESLHYLHGHNETQKYYFHRDIKPDNIMINDHLDSPRCILIDFNTVRESDDTHVNNPTMIGSRPFMPPELTDGERHTFRRHMELYSLGSVLYYYITGKTPTGMIQNGNTREDIVNELRHASSEKEISEELQAIILKAVENDPEFRYQSAEEMQEDIEAQLLEPEQSEAQKLIFPVIVTDSEGKVIIPQHEQLKVYYDALDSIAIISDPESFLHYFLGMSNVNDNHIANYLLTLRKQVFDDKWPEWVPATIHYYACDPEENDMVMPTYPDLSKDDYGILRKALDSFTNDIESDTWFFLTVVTFLLDRIETESREGTLEETNMNHDVKKLKWDKDAFLFILNKFIYVNIDEGDDDEDIMCFNWSYSDLSAKTQEKIMQALFMYVNADSKENVFAGITAPCAISLNSI